MTPTQLRRIIEHRGLLPDPEQCPPPTRSLVRRLKRLHADMRFVHARLDTLLTEMGAPPDPPVEGDDTP